MTKRIFLTIANFLGVVVLTGIVIAQWLRENRLHQEIDARGERIAGLQTKLSESEARATAFESDVSQLKEAVESTAKARAEAEKKLAELTTAQEQQTAAANSATTQAQANVDAAKEKIEDWQKAIVERDARIKELSASLAATRARLDEAIAKLKAAGAR